MTKMALFACQECGRKFYSTAAAERALNNGCPGCGGSDIDEAPYEPRPSPPLPVRVAGPVCRCVGGKVCPRHGHG
jgi:DNA-directed RNA polymerase subunit RPC12/RpoP